MWGEHLTLSYLLGPCLFLTNLKSKSRNELLAIVHLKNKPLCIPTARNSPGWKGINKLVFKLYAAQNYFRGLER